MKKQIKCNMAQNSQSLHMNKPTRKFQWMILLLMPLVGGWPSLYAQDSTAVSEEKEDAAIKTKMSLAGSQFPDGTIHLDALLRSKVQGSYQKTPDQKISFFAVNDAAEEIPLGDTLSGQDGIARFVFNTNGKATNKDGTYSFIARYDGNDHTNGSESDLMLKPAKLVMEATEGDSTYSLKLQANALGTDGPKPIAEATVSVYVKRMFSSLKVAEGSTDADGMVEVDFPKGLSGDQEGNLNITAKIEETDEYGNLEANIIKPWGKTVSYEITELPHALWSDHPPVWMIVTFFVLMGTVWIHYLIIIFKLFRIKTDKTQPEGS
jgi:hypothetical protein